MTIKISTETTELAPSRDRPRQQHFQGSPEFLERIINSVADPVFVKDREHRWIFINDTFVRMMGHTREELLGKTDFDFLPKQQAQIFHEKDEVVFLTGRENINEEQLTDSTGVTHTIETKKILLKDNDGRSFIVGIIHDMTAQKKAEDDLRSLNATLEARVAERSSVAEARAAELVKSNAELERFAYVASHDLQEPLRMVASYVQLLERRYKDKLEPDALEFIHYAVDGVTRMKHLINDLLEYSRLGRTPNQWKPTPAEDVLQQVVAMLRATVDESHASVTWTHLPTVQSDPSQLAQVFQNLIGNAIKFRGTAVPRVHVSAQAQDDAWMFSVADNGIGIDPQHAERIFDVFQRLHTSEEYPGTGIGLAICKRIVERHGGHIWVESARGHGSTFYFTIPKSSGGAS